MFPSTVLRCLCIAITLKPALVTANSIKRNDPRLPIHGTKNWELLNGPKFSPRHSHATCIFRCPDDSNDSCIWLTGGYSESHRTFDVEIMENENSDVWWSKDGANWNQVTKLYGDFLQGGNGDALVGGYVAPWYSRYGHSLNALDGDADGIADVMVLVGGFSPLPSNDVWISRDGITWRFDGFAPWPKRAYHGAAVFQDKLWIMGGTPLSNDVWSASFQMGSEETSRDVGFKLVWEQMLPPNEAPWTPRAGFCVVTQLRRNTLPESLDANSTELYENMFILGGLAVSDGDPLQSDGTRTRNDVWKTSDGISWERVVPPTGKTMPWAGRAFHSCVTWHSLEDRSRWVGDDSKNMHLTDDQREGNNTIPRIFITGGGYMGTKGNNDVREIDAYTDSWWSYDGADWVRINYEEGSKHDDNLYSTQEWTETNIEDRKVYRGKWGHSLEAFHVTEDLDKEGEISSTIDACADSKNETTSCKKMVPALLVVGGKLDSMMLVNDVFVSKPGVHCELDGVTCNRNGNCGLGTEGCICHSNNLAGDYCLY